MDMDKKVMYLKGLVVGVVTLISDKFGIVVPALILLSLLMVVDYLSGMLASKKEALEHPNNKKYGWSSKKSIIGIYKKVGYMLTILVAFSADYLIFYILKEIGFTYQADTLFGILVTVWFVLNEILSILENVGRMGVAIPAFFKKVLATMRDDIEKEK